MRTVALKLKDQIERAVPVFYENGQCIMDAHLINLYKTEKKSYNKLSKCTGINPNVGVQLYNNRKMTVD